MSYELFQLFVTETTWNHTTLIICFKTRPTGLMLTC